MNYLLTDELARKWGVSPTRIRVMAKNGQIPGARLIGNTWTFPLEAEKPLDGRSKAGKAKEAQPAFAFPLYLLKRVDEASLNDEQRRYLNCERMVHDLDFDGAYLGFHEIANTSLDTSLLAGSFYYLCQVSAMLEKYDEAFLFCRKLSALLSRDVPHQKELDFLLWELRTFTHDRSFVIPEWDGVHEFHPSCGPEMLLIQSYSTMLHSLKAKSPIDPNPYEIAALVLDQDDFPLTNVYLHLHLGIMWSFNKNLEMKCLHLKLALDAAIKHKLYFAVVNYLNLFGDTLSKVAPLFPQAELQKMIKANAQYTHSDQEIRERAIQTSIPFLSQEDHAFMTYLLEGFTSAELAKAKGISEKTIYKHYSDLRNKFGAKNKKELLEKYRLFLMA